jgi:hypothetical protein
MVAVTTMLKLVLIFGFLSLDGFFVVIIAIGFCRSPAKNQGGWLVLESSNWGADCGGRIHEDCITA